MLINFNDEKIDLSLYEQRYGDDDCKNVYR